MANNVREDWTHVRMRLRTKARLEAYRDELLAKQRADGKGAQPWLDGNISINDVIETLLFRKDEHAARSKASRQRRQAAKNAVQS